MSFLKREINRKRKYLKREKGKTEDKERDVIMQKEKFPNAITKCRL